VSTLRTGRSRHAHRSRGPRGVSLIELLVVLLAIGILAGIAVPSYRAQLLRTNRTEGRAALLALAVAQEKFYLECHRYAMELDPAQAPDCETQRLRFAPASERGRYQLEVTAADALGWSATATPDGPPQDADAPCQTLGLDSTGHRTAKDVANADSSLGCWSR
jgi:type IV pilus assembly protein PilE